MSYFYMNNEIKLIRLNRTMNMYTKYYLYGVYKKSRRLQFENLMAR